MEIRVFRDEDIDEINGWMESRAAGRIPSEFLSRTGYIAPDVACGFLYATDSRICFLDFYISNPKIPAEKRSEALDKITISLIKTAKERKYKLIMGASSHKGIIDRCIRFGFKHQCEQSLHTMEIN